MNLIASNILSRKMHNVSAKCIIFFLITVLPVVYVVKGHGTFMGTLDSTMMVFGVWGTIGAVVSYLLLNSPLVRFTDTHVIVERYKSTQEISWKDILGCNVIPQSVYAPANPVRLKVKGRILGLSFAATPEAKVVLEGKFGKLRWGI